MKVGATQSIAIVGAGPAGTLLALLLAQRGFRVELFERHPDQRLGLAPAGRSINLAIGERGRHALRLAGVLDEVDAGTLPMRGRMLHDEAGQLRLQPYGASELEVIYSAHREQLNNTLLDAAQASGRVRIHFDHPLEQVDWAERRLLFAGQRTYPFEVLLGADGAGSAVRKAMQRVTDLGVREQLLDHGYLELDIPPAADGGFALDPAALHIWPRGGFMLIALPNVDRSFTGTLFLANQGEPSFAALDNWPAQAAFFARQFPDAVSLLPDLRTDFRDHPIGLLGTIRCRQWQLDERAVLLGDAAHAIVPFQGQGMNAALEDCVTLAELVTDRDLEWSELFARYQALRADNANAIADMALENYLVMRDSVRDPRFALRKALEHELERRFGERFVARYSLIMFHRIPYAECFARGLVQDEILQQLLAGVEQLDEVDFACAGQLIEKRLAPLSEPA